MYLWESIVLILSSTILAISSIVALFGRTGLLSRWVFFVGGLLFAGLFFRIYTFYPDPGFENLNLPLDINLILVVLPFVWLLFSSIFAREDYRDSLKRGRLWITLIGILAAGFAIGSIFYPIFRLFTKPST